MEDSLLQQSAFFPKWLDAFRLCANKRDFSTGLSTIPWKLLALISHQGCGS